MSWTRQQVLLMLEQYQLYPWLYEVKHVRYKNKYARSDALEHIKHVLLPLRPGTTINDIKAKYGMLRSTYTLEFKKVQTSLRSGAAPDELYIPSLYYYEKMDSMIGTEIKATTDAMELSISDPLRIDVAVDNVISKNETNLTSNEEAFEEQSFYDLQYPSYIELPPSDSIASPAYSPAPGEQESRQKIRIPRAKRRKKEPDVSDTTMEEGLAVLRSIASNCSKQNQPKNTHIDYFLNYIGRKMCEIKNRVRLEKLMLRISSDVTNTLLQDMEENKNNS